jgi:hypothetical protein
VSTNTDKETKDILDTWQELDGQLISQGIIINDSGAKNVVILAMAKCYGLGKKTGEEKGFVEAMERIIEKSDTWKFEKSSGFELSE